MRGRRRTPRRRTHFGARIALPFLPSETACLLRNVSDAGARIELSAAVPLPAQFDLVVDCRQRAYRAEIVWRAGDALGVRFLADGARSDLPTDPLHAVEGSPSEPRRLH